MAMSTVKMAVVDKTAFGCSQTPVDMLTRRFLRFKATLPDLPYDYGALEPVISGKIMEIHHKKHHAAYVNNYNATVEKLQTVLAQGNGVKETSQIVNLQGAINFNGGGHVNHSIFWKNLIPPKDFIEPSKLLSERLNANFGNFQQFQTLFQNAAMSVQGSGWAWLGMCPNTKRLIVTTTANQDSLQSSRGLIPLLGLDVWEHAYYLQYQNVRGDYVNAIWKVINWKDVESRLMEATNTK